MTGGVVGDMVGIVRREGVPLSWDVAGLRDCGYAGFVTFAAVESSPVPAVRGTYVVLRVGAQPPSFTTPSFALSADAGRVGLEELRARWDGLCTGDTPPSVLYIGKTDARRGLRQRLNQYRRAGLGGGSHRGGRHVWRLADADALLVAWRPLSPAQQQRGLSAKRHEDELLVAYMLDHQGLTPWANTAPPSRAARVAAGLA